MKLYLTVLFLVFSLVLGISQGKSKFDGAESRSCTPETPCTSGATESRSCTPEKPCLSGTLISESRGEAEYDGKKSSKSSSKRKMTDSEKKRFVKEKGVDAAKKTMLKQSLKRVIKHGVRRMGVIVDIFWPDDIGLDPNEKKKMENEIQREGEKKIEQIENEINSKVDLSMISVIYAEITQEEASTLERLWRSQAYSALQHKAEIYYSKLEGRLRASNVNSFTLKKNTAPPANNRPKKW